MIIDPGPADLAMALALYAAVVALSIREGLGVERSLTIATVRMTVQLFFIGYVIELIFGVNLWYVVVVALFLMMTYAARAGLSRMRRPVPGLYIPMWTGVVAGSLFTTAVVTGAVLKADPWYRPEILLPLGGMILGNAMNGGALAADRLYAEMKARQDEIETLLMLGWSHKRAAAEARRESIRAALIPTINTMMTVGLVHLPGIMVGQMLGGAPPVVAAKYQMIIMLMVASSVTIAAVVFTGMGLGRFFTPRQQLKRWLFME